MELSTNGVQAAVRLDVFGNAFGFSVANLAFSRPVFLRGLVPPALAPLSRQLGTFVGVGLVATTVHYLILIVLVQAFDVSPVAAALTGFSVGGVLSYTLHRRHTFGSERPHQEAAWRFALVAGVAFGLTFVSMRLLIDRLLVPYLLAQIVTTGLVMVWTFAANRLWTFRGEV